ncbi:MAG: hypothetical protein ACAH80_10405 [Alphaproteobacteria bacterium]
MLDVKPETLAQMDDKELAARKADAEKLDRRVKANFSIKGLIGWVLGAAAIAGTLALFGLPMMAFVLPVAAAIAVVPPAASYAATFYTQAELKRITDTIRERSAPKQKIEVIFEDGTKSTVSAATRSMSPIFTAKAVAGPGDGVDSLPQVAEALTEGKPAVKPLLLLPAPPKAA